MQERKTNHILLYLACEGASILKWIALDPCLVFSESDSKLYTKFEFCEEKNY